MHVHPPASNGHAPKPPADPLADLLARVRSGPPTDAALFGLFAEVARSVKRADLATEFAHRAGAAPSAPDGTDPVVEAARHQHDGCTRLAAGQFAEAEAAFRTAIRLDPDCADAHGNLGVAYAQQRKLPEAEAAFQLAIRLKPSNTTMYVNLATCLTDQGRPAEAEGWARQAAQRAPENVEAHRLLGLALDARRRLEPAEAAFREAVRLDPDHADTRFRFGRVLARRNNLTEAEPEYRAAVRLKPELGPAWTLLAQLLADTDRAAEAVECARTGIRLEPKGTDGHNTLGVALAGSERFTEAEAAYREALRLEPKNVSAHSNLGNTLRCQGRLTEAEASLRHAVRLKGDYPEAHNNLGIVLVQQGREAEGQKHYDEALRLRAEYPEARMNRSLSWLADGDFARGWPEYEARFQVNRKHKTPPGPRWDGSPLNGKTLLVLSEQGLGDSIQFVRYLQRAQERGGTVLFDCPEALVALVKTCPGIDRVVSRAKGVTYDTHIPLLSLPALFGVPPEVPTAPIPYLTPDPERVEFWRQELESVPGLRVGIAWQGSKAHKGDRLRSVPLTRFAPLAAVPGVTLCSLQKGYGTEQLAAPDAAGLGIIDLGVKTASDMADVAALMMSLDLVIAVDTALVHLAGALGRPVWAAVSFVADWRWQRGSETTRWYPSARLFRQATWGDWDGVFARLAEELTVAARLKAEGRWPAPVAEGGS